MKKSTSAGPDNITYTDIRKIYPTIKPYLLKEINYCLKNGKFPKLCKIAKVIPIYKKGESTKPENYRPISITSIFSKIIEKVIKQKLVNFFNISKHQYGFQSGSSTQGATVDLVEYIISKMESGENVVAVFIDLMKAFDTIEIRILLKKLKKMGISGVLLKLLTSFLNDRFQYTMIDGVESKRAKVNCGVPQGTVLGPLLYLLYVESLSLVGLQGKYYMFADDTVLIYSSKNTNDLQVLANEDLKLFGDWLISNKLLLSVEKTVFMQFKTKHTKAPIVSIGFDGHPLKSISTYKYLGLYIKDNLSWDSHIESFIKKTSCMIGAFRHIASLLDYETKKTIYYAHIQSTLQYLVSIWSNTTKFNLNRINNLQKKALKTLFGKLYNKNNQMSLVNSQILNFENLRIFEQSKLIYNIQNKSIKTNVNISINSSKHDHGTRNAFQVATAKVRTNLGKNSPIQSCIRSFNTLPRELIQITNQKKFSETLKKYLLNLQK